LIYADAAGATRTSQASGWRMRLCVVDLFFLMFCLRVRASHDIP
jgi:hypothetical protein